MRPILAALALMLAAPLALAKLPAPSEATQAKAAENAARTAWQGKADAYQLCQAQNRVVAWYRAHRPTGTAAASAAPASDAACADPGPFAYNAPAQTPLETSGAHSPAGTAAQPPSVAATSGQMQPAPKK